MNFYKFFTNYACEYYPCHKSNKINCLHCFCPLYNLRDCDGGYKVLDNGLKDCSECSTPHSEEGHDYIVDKLKERGMKWL